MRKNLVGLLAVAVVITVGLYAGFGMKSQAVVANGIQPAAHEDTHADTNADADVKPDDHGHEHATPPSEGVTLVPSKTYAMGNPDAPVKIKEFASLSCSHCAEFHTGTFPEVKKELIDTGKVYFEFVNFPLNSSAMDGALIALCMPEERYHQFISFLFEQQAKWAFDADYQKILKQNAKLLGASEEKLDACLADEAKKLAIVAQMQEAKEKYHIESTPSFVINETETFSGALSFKDFKAKVDSYTPPEKAQEKAAE